MSTTQLYHLLCRLTAIPLPSLFNLQIVPAVTTATCELPCENYSAQLHHLLWRLTAIPVFNIVRTVPHWTLLDIPVSAPAPRVQELSLYSCGGLSTIQPTPSLVVGCLVDDCHFFTLTVFQRVCLCARLISMPLAFYTIVQIPGSPR